MQGVRLQDLAVVHQAAQLLGTRRQFLGADDVVERLGRRKVMRDRADAAQPLHHHRHFPIRAPLDELLETTEFDDVQANLLHLVVGVEQQRDLAVPFDARHRIDGHPAQRAGFGGGGFECESLRCHGGVPQSKCSRGCPSRGVRPSSRSVRNFQMASPEGGQPGMK
jgi:hypothetical protein